MYCVTNYPTKAAVKRAIAKHGHAGEVFQPGLGPDAPDDGTVTVEGPHYPKPHNWYGVATLNNGQIVGIK